MTYKLALSWNKTASDWPRLRGVFSKSSSCYFHLSASSLRPCLMPEAVDVRSLSWSVRLELFLYMITRRLIIPTATSLQPSITVDGEKRLQLFFFLPSTFFCVFFFSCFSSPIRCSFSGTEQRCFSSLSTTNWLAHCHLCARADLVQQLQHVIWPFGRAGASSFDNDVFAFRSLCLQCSNLCCNNLFNLEPVGFCFFLDVFAYSLHSRDF